MSSFVSKGSSGISSQGKFSTLGFLTKYKANLFEFLVNVAENSVSFKTLINFVEVYFFLASFVNFFPRLFSWNSDVYRTMNNICVFVNPVAAQFVTPTFYSVLFIIAVVWVVIGFVLCIYGFLNEEASSNMFFLCGAFLKLSRTVFFFPLLNIFLAPLACHFFDGTFGISLNGGGEVQRCIDIPFFFFTIFGPLLAIMLFLLLSLDHIFLVEKFLDRSNIISSSPDGRSNFLVFLFVTAGVVFQQLSKSGFSTFVHLEYIVMMVATVCLLLLLVRFVPFYNVYFVFLLGFMGSLSMGFYFFLLMTANSKILLYALFAIAVFVLSLIVCVVLLLIRYRLLFVHFKKSEMGTNVLCAYFPIDFVMGIYLVNLKRSPFNLKGTLKRLKVNGSSAVTPVDDKNQSKFGAKIMKLINNDKNIKSKTLCHMLIPFVINDVRFSQKIINHAKTVRSFSLLDVQFFIYVLENKIMDLQNAGGHKMNLEVQKTLNKIKKKERRLSFLLHTLFRTLGKDEEDGALEKLKYPQLISSIRSLREYCFRGYEKLLTQAPGPVTYRRYALYLEKFESNVELAARFIELAKDLENSNSEMSETISRIEGISDPGSLPFSDHAGSERMSRISKMSSGVGSVHSKMSSRMNKRAITNSIRKKIRSSQFLSVVFLNFVLTAVYIIGIGCLVGVLVVCFQVVSRYENSNELIEKASRIRMESVGVAHFFRKNQISTYPFPRTFFDHERNTSSFRARTKHVCEDLLKNTKDLYRSVGAATKKVWKEYQVELITEMRLSDEDHLWHAAKRKNFSLIDSVSVYAEQCLSLLKKNDTFFQSPEMLSSLEFQLLTVSEPMVHDGLKAMLRSLITEEETFSETVRISLLVIPAVCLCCVLLFVVASLYYSCQFRVLRRGLRMIPKEYLFETSEKFSTSRSGESIIKLSNEIQSFSPIQFFLIISCIIVVFIVLLQSAMTILGITASTQYNARNNELDVSCQLEVVGHRIHLWAVELIYRDDTLFQTYEIVDGIEADVETLQHIYQDLRFGNTEKGLPGNDQQDYAFPVYYHDSCERQYEESELTGADLFHDLECLNLNRQVFLMQESVANLLNINISNPDVARRHHSYEIIVALDNVDVDEVVNEGAMRKKIEVLISNVGHQLDSLIQVLNSVSLIFAILVIPIFIIVFPFLYYYPANLARNLRAVKELFLLFPHSFLVEKHIYKYLTSTSSSSMNILIEKIFDQEKIARMEKFYGIMNMSSYSVIAFDKNFRIYFANESAKSLFALRENGLKMISEIFEESSFDKLSMWMKKAPEIVYRGELHALIETSNRTTRMLLSSESQVSNSAFPQSVSNLEEIVNQKQMMLEDNDQMRKAMVKFPILADISRDRDMFIGIFENVTRVTSSDEVDKRKYKKRVLQLEKVVRNLLPRKIAHLLVDEVGKCCVSYFKQASVLFMDISNFTSLMSKNPNEILHLLHEVWTSVDSITPRFGVEKIKTIGDCYMAVTSVPIYTPSHALDMMQFAIELIDLFRKLSKDKGMDLSCRIGIASGSVWAGVLGKIKSHYDCWGETCNLASRMESSSAINKIQVSQSTYDLIFDKFEFVKRTHSLQGVGLVTSYSYSPENESPPISMKSSSGQQQQLEEVVEEMRESSDEQLPILDSSSVSNNGGKLSDSETTGLRLSEFEEMEKELKESVEQKE